MINTDERLNRPEAVFFAMQEVISAGLYVSLPCIIQSFNADAVTITAQPAIRWKIRQKDGELESVSLPLLVDVPVIFPRGGGVTLTFPVRVGDECLVVFADRCIDYWWQSGGVQEPVDPRQHNLSDGFALIGPQSQQQKISNISTHTAQLRSDDGAAYIELDPNSHNVTIITPAKLTATANGGTEITSPDIILNGNVTINGNLSQGMGAGGGTATLQGPVTVSHDVTAAGISLKNHVHSGVQSGRGKTGKPQ
ncbi:phage baseplate assembly protein V [Photorhabdus laumondii subsp. laumondii]|uniref:Phage baseplate assembly protein V n=1 Tax=Photorhabdus laumondii subsp. laumondii TaxID=141679 RepID=A0A6L9JQ67_PHOLM|nr:MULTISPECIES: phage baseplate assembly protein V [Photorhabdus]AXG43504.1 phage baseplate assembly protein V [Photorhabdus laumondii subsp. laumondii]KTL59778.1 translation initiation factor IF-2 [Photorhabdus laumondii subsp. laumondii]MCC8382572.1 phage baseplate assembly protein V [Photorhabdus laumondii]MCC8387928.1 phage baseplate assembly protein V [Photorhabdus laumondii]MCC8412217.1 phage baseplate assembly protein V [Photorhabdus laumondii]